MIKGVRMFLLMAICCTVVSCKEKNHHNDSSANKALREGYVFVDMTESIVHWDNKCKRVIKNIMLLKSMKELKYNVKYCSCIPIDKHSIIKSEILKSCYFTKSDKGKVSIRKDSGEERSVRVDNIMKYGLEAYSVDYPNYTIRMQDNRGQDYDIPLKDVFRALDQGLKIYTFN